jgi:hypothetical protein
MKNEHKAMFLGLAVLLLGGGLCFSQSPDDSQLRVVRTLRSLPIYDLDSLFPHLEEEELSALRSEGKVSAFTSPGYDVHYGPRMWTVDQVEKSLASLEPAFSLESVYLIPLQQEIRNAEDPDLFIYNVLRSISTMEGLQYYSQTREKWRELFHESRVINNLEDQREIPDPKVSRIPAYEQIYAFQHDSSFGKNTYTVTYRYRDGAYYLRLVNQSPVRYLGIVPVVSRENMHVYVSVVATDEGLVFYGHAAVDVLTTLGMEGRLRRSFENRVEAIFTWFQNEVEAQGRS